MARASDYVGVWIGVLAGMGAQLEPVPSPVPPHATLAFNPLTTSSLSRYGLHYRQHCRYDANGAHDDGSG